MVGYFFFRLALVIVSIIPLRILYLISDGIYFLLRYVFSYRKKVIETNLRNAFPDYSDEKIAQLIKDVYRNLTDILVESFKGITMSVDEVNKRFKYVNPELPNAYLEKRQSVVFVAAHYTNWEWGLKLGSQVKHLVIGIYGVISNKYINDYMLRSRQIDNFVLAPPRETFKTIDKYKNHPAGWLLIADQNPSNVDAAHWVNLFDVDTACHHGPDTIARVNDFPMIFIEFKRVRRGYYEAEFSLVHENPKALIQGKLTELYMKKVEKMIQKNPGDWLWSHKRWKHKRNV